MMVITNKKAIPLEAEEGEYINWYSIPYLEVNVPSSQTDGVTAFTFVGTEGENYVATVKIRQELDPLYRSEIWLNKEYIERERSMADIADQFGITPAAINQWLNKHDIPTRSRGRNHE